jgi:heat shock protein HslJ
MRLVNALLAALLAMASGFGCADHDGGSADSSVIQGVPWVLSSGVDVERWREVAPSVTFDDGRMAGFTGCNRFTASYEMDGDTLEIGEVASTRMACPPPADAVEADYVPALGRVTAWRSENGELALLDAEGRTVHHYRVATPVGLWQATGFLQGEAVKSLIPATVIEASFAESGALLGSAGCNAYRATYTTDRGRIEITQPAATKKACASPAGVMAQEAAYLAALPSAVRYRVEGRSLVLLNGEGKIVVSYTRVPEP